MGFTKESAVDAAKSDLAKRLKLSTNDIKVSGTSDTEFPDMLTVSGTTGGNTSVMTGRKSFSQSSSLPVLTQTSM